MCTRDRVGAGVGVCARRGRVGFAAVSEAGCAARSAQRVARTNLPEAEDFCLGIFFAGAAVLVQGRRILAWRRRILAWRRR